jgi:hypothetical protein
VKKVVKKEGTGKPRTPDIEFVADVKMRELYFEEVPDPDVRFRGSTRRNSVWGSERENLPDRVQEGVVYRDAEVRLRIATEMVEEDSGSLHNPSRERVKDRLRTPETEVRQTEDRRRKTESIEETE